jgi:hypothetical protein
VREHLAVGLYDRLARDLSEAESRR